ncbi:tyrosine-protein phosphatase [Parabacteroides bouchesdurhonensis]|uniref:tyrosine-protein phosphatase n=1 Tax=Parabacteroides bouchesdurhonensis TaxID=1936995 RepID=UPI0018FE1B03|nr:CpsB/CapC family capsule biosynthesis tyrosine phosphatase [Parabacteroides bouchesdurhonensis]
MLNFFTKNKIALPFSFADVHTHILPCVDDGVSSVKEALELLSFLKERGVERLFFTPHVMADYPRNNASYLNERLRSFMELYMEHTPDKYPEIRLAAEYMLDEEFYFHLDKGLLTYDGIHALVEMSCLQRPMGLEEMLYKIQLYNYVPVLAHPERYLFLSQSDFIYLKELGCRFQLNLFSLQGLYGASVKENAERLLGNGLYDFVGSDIHSANSTSLYENFFLKRKSGLLVKDLMEKNEVLFREKQSSIE